MKPIMLLCCSLLLTSLTLNATVKVQVNQHDLQFDAPPTLVQVLEPVALTNNWYWPAAKLYRLSGLSAEEQRTEVLQLLEQFKQGQPAETAAELSSLQYQLKQWRLAERVIVPIDYDRARIEPSYNPRFEPGQYLLQLVKRPLTVQFWGALTNVLELPHRGGTAIADYVSALSYSKLADSSVVYVIQPNGSVIKSGVAAWNLQHVEAMPGARVFVPFSTSSFSSEAQRLNDSLLALALQRVE